ncbi:hypothetical protein LVB87_11435 [Lysobacter sp. KIS68-7]|uniref:hypothetical protein n=1 Tax=Lysobacter sp. KIS68-7 TaxID=2904252 RepID=UPI001E58D4A4|nr:hypothetical protein [Lysobacter sp. KIS68-7]UHQ18794.1 hypothetical protein LVB87_11435 [Lysobacter sp. KIS68-7]
MDQPRDAPDWLNLWGGTLRGAFTMKWLFQLVALKRDRSAKALLFACVLSMSFVAMSAHANEPAAPKSFPIGPWTLGMSRDQVRAIADQGPYVDVPVTGALETSSADFHGAKTKVSFVFDDAGLQYMQVFAYEGHDVEEAQNAAFRVYRLFADELGGATMNPDVPRDQDQVFTDDMMRVVFASLLGRARIAAGGILDEMPDARLLMHFDMAPTSQPADSRMHAQIGYESAKDTYFVLLFKDRVDAPPRRVKANVEVSKAE